MWNLLMLKYRRNEFFGLSERNSDCVEKCHDVTVFAFSNKKLHHNLRIYKAYLRIYIRIYN